MKTLIQSLFIACSISLVSVAASVAETNPGSRPARVASFKTGIYTTVAGKLNIALDKEATGVVDVRLKNNTGEVVFYQRIARREKTSRIRLDMSEMKDGAYQVEISNGVETAVHSVTISTQQPTTPSRLIAIN